MIPKATLHAGKESIFQGSFSPVCKTYGKTYKLLV